MSPWVYLIVVDRGEPVKLKYHPGDLSRLYAFDPFEKRYLEVPALEHEYTAGLSLWKHRVIRRFAASEADRVDLAALGRAKRKIQEVVDAALSRKRRRAGRRVGRWQTSGQPPSLAPGVPATPSPSVPASGPLLLAPANDEDLIMPPPVEEGWGLSYSLPASLAPVGVGHEDEEP